MPEKKEVTAAQIFAATFKAPVEDKTLDECLREIGFSEEQLFNESIYPKSSPAAIEYARAMFSEGTGPRRAKGTFLYVVKKVLCNPQDYDSIAEAVSGEDTDKFKVLRLIGCNAKVLKYKHTDQGIEEYMVTGKNSLEAMHKTTAEEPVFNYHGTEIHPWEIKEYDEMFMDIIYNHTPESVERFFNKMNHIF